MADRTEIVYVDLDCLLDTRLGTLALANEQWAVNALKQGYHQRRMDEFPDINWDDFKKLYETRTADVLPMSVYTNMFVVLANILKAEFDHTASGGQGAKIEIQVNYHPYDLEPEEIGALCQAISHRTMEMADVRMVSVSDGFLTPAYCRDTFAMMIRYTYEPWIETHVKAFEDCKMPGMALLAPALYQKIPSDEETKEFSDLGLDPLRATEITLAPLFALRLLDANAFSIHDGIRLGQPKPPEPEVQSEPAKTPPATKPASSDDDYDLL